MPHSYAIDTERGLMRLRASGLLTTAELQEVREQGASDPAFDRRFATLIDLREVTRFVPDRAFIRRMAERPLLDMTTKLAIVPPAHQPYLTADLFAAYARICGRPVRVFRDIEAAERWLVGGVIDRATSQKLIAPDQRGSDADRSSGIDVSHPQRAE